MVKTVKVSEGEKRWKEREVGGGGCLHMANESF